MTRFIDPVRLECVDCGTIFDGVYLCPKCGSEDIFTVDDEVPTYRKKKTFDDEPEKRKRKRFDAGPVSRKTRVVNTTENNDEGEE
jgi:predicted  nucleic acid-binding Zn-ribbon protein